MIIVLNVFIAIYVLFHLLWDKRDLLPFRSIVLWSFRAFDWLGLSHSWAMYAPDVPRSTRLLVTGVSFSDGRFEEVRLPYFDGQDAVGQARGLRFITYQRSLLSAHADPLRRAVCSRVIRQWMDGRQQVDLGPTEAPTVPAAVELREFAYDASPAGDKTSCRPRFVRTVFAVPVDELV